MKKLMSLAVLALALLISPAAHAQLNSNTVVGLQLNVTVVESLTISATPSSITFNGAAGTVTGSSPINITTNYVLNPNTRSKVVMYAYLSGNPNALTGLISGHFILDNQVLAGWDGGGFQACTASDPFSGADCLGGGMTIVTNNAPASRWPAGTSSDQIALEINLGSAGVTPIDQYSGTLNIVASAM